ncbi:hypothetical protein BBJ28_00019379 [Nothophytophthora sp. Chile5]|nr:hypothetical protein BBJ28_00019379 [Nothophytophthora sp. Chile5]
MLSRHRSWSTGGRRRALSPLYLAADIDGNPTTASSSANIRHVCVLTRRELHALHRPASSSSAALAPPTTLYNTTKRWHSGHGHSHGVLGLADEEVESEALRRKLSAADVQAADRITWIGVALNVVLSGLKGVAGVTFHSSGLLADAVHSMSDLVSDFVTLVALRYCARPPDASQPYGYGKYETMGGLSVSLLLIGGSLGIMGHSLDTLLVLMEPAAHVVAVVDPTEVAKLVEHVDSETLEAVQALADSSTKHNMAIHPAALGIATLSVAAKEALYRTTIAIGRRVHSSVLIANAWHHRSDAVTSVVAMAGIGLSIGGFPMFDPLAGIAVGGIILKMGAEIGWDAAKELCDVQLPPTIVASLQRAVDGVIEASNGEIRAVHQLRSRKVGRHIHVDLTLVLDDASPVSLERAVEWKQQVKNAIQHEVPRVKDIIVEIATPEPVASGSSSH